MANNSNINPYWVGDVLVIGSGWSGMLTAKHCRENGLTVRIIEKSDYAGGVWKYNEDVPGEWIEWSEYLNHQSSSMITIGGVMASTQTTSSWSFTEISDFPLRTEDGLVTDFPKHDLVLDYLQRYAKHNGLNEITSYGASVVNVIKDDKNRFNIFTSDGRLYISDKLCVSTGFLGNPRSKGFEVSNLIYIIIITIIILITTIILLIK